MCAICFTAAFIYLLIVYFVSQCIMHLADQMMGSPSTLNTEGLMMTVTGQKQSAVQHTLMT